MDSELICRMLRTGLASYVGCWAAVPPAESVPEALRHWAAKGGRPGIAFTDTSGPIVSMHPRTTQETDSPDFLPHASHPPSCALSCMVHMKGWIALRVSLPMEKEWVLENLSCLEGDEDVLRAIQWQP